MLIEEDIYLEHYGKKGMKWGVRSANRSLNKASRQKDRTARKEDYKKAVVKLDKQIDSARSRTADGKAKAKFKKTKAQYKVDKQTMGSREAKKILRKSNTKIMADIQTSRYAKSGRETTKAVIAVVGLTTISALLRASG